MSDIKRTLTEVLDFENGEIIQAVSFFKLSESEVFLTRKRLERAIQKKDGPKFICLYCKQLITIVGKPSGEGKKIKYFKHLKDSEDCVYKTNGKLTKSEVLRIKYNGAKESLLHINLKNFIAQRLQDNQTTKKEIDEVKIEKVYKNIAISKEWKKPDVSAIFKNKSVVFELQLSTTFLSEIVKREDYYFKNSAYILWIFHHFEEKSDLQKFTQKDIIYSNNRNAFILSEEAKKKSIEANDLVLECLYQFPSIINNEILYKWEKVFVTLSDLKFEENTFKIFYYDSDSEFKKLETVIKKENEQEILKKNQKENDWKSLKIKKTLDLIRDFYSKNEFSKQFIIVKELNHLTDDERVFLNRNINVIYQGKPLLFHLAGKNINDIFLHFWLSCELLPIDVNEDWNGKSLIEELYYGERNIYERGSLFRLIFDRGYNASLHNDYTFIIKELNNNIDVEEEANLYRLRYFLTLNNPTLIPFYLAIEKVIFAIQSCESNKIIGSKLKNFLALSNNFIEHHTYYVEKYLQALKFYGQYEEVIAIDTKKTFRNKLENFQKMKPLQKDDLDIIFKELFPQCYGYNLTPIIIKQFS